MRLIPILAVAAVALCASSAVAEKKLPKQALALLALTPEGAAALTTLKDDSLEIKATITTEKVFSERHGLLGIIWDDNFVRAFVDKKSGKATYQVYQRLTYVAPGFRMFENVNYETPPSGDPSAAELVQLGRDVDCSSSQLLGGCTYHEDVAFEIDEKLLRAIAAAYKPYVEGDRPSAWKFRFKSRAGVDANEFMMAAEVAGALLAVDRYRVAHNLPSAS